MIIWVEEGGESFNVAERDLMKIKSNLTKLFIQHPLCNLLHKSNRNSHEMLQNINYTIK